MLLISSGSAKRLLTTSIRSYRSCSQSLRSCSFTFSIAVLLICSGCTVQNKQPNNSSTSNEVFSSTPPFKTIEPERYQAIRVVTFTPSDGARQVTRTFIAKDGLARREEILGTRPVVYLHLANGIFILFPNARIYSDSNPVTESTPASTPLDEMPEPLLHEGGAETFYRQLGHEDFNGRRLQRYQVVNGSTSPNVTNTETVMWVDEELGMPVKTEIRSGNGNTTIIEITDVKREIDKKFFQIPEDYRKVSREEIQQALRQK